MLRKRIFWLTVCCGLAVSGFAQESSVITDVKFSGNTHVSKEAIEARMKTRVGQPYVQAQLDTDKEAILSMGFFKAVDVRAQALEGLNWRINVEVVEYPMIKEIRIVGNTVVKSADILAAIPAKAGSLFNLTYQRPSAQAIFDLYAKKGYFGLVDQLEPLEDSPGTLNIVIREMKVNSLAIQGNTRTKTSVFQHMIKTRPGDIFNIRRWDDDLRRIYSTQWFEKLEPIEKDAPDGFAKDLIIDVKEGRTGNAVAGLSVDPRSSFAGSIKLNDTNFRGTGQSIGFSMLQAVSGGGASLDLDYTHPFIDNRDTSLSIGLYSRLLYRFSGTGFGSGGSPTDERFTERRTGMSLNFTRPLSAKSSGNLGARYEGIRTGELTTTNVNSFIQQDGSVGVLSLGFTQNRRDVDFDAAAGDWLQATIEPGFSNITRLGGAFQDPTILGRSSFVRSTLEYRSYYSPQGPRGRELDAARKVLAFRARFGMVSGKVPFFEQYFVGGSDSLRGYQDDRFWGKQMLSTTLEYRQPVQKSFNIIGFVDTAGAWGGYGTVNNFDQAKKFKLNVGYGVGFSFRTPIGPIRLDFGFNNKGGSRTHFLIGTSF